jgi:hypothetical protein
VAGGKRSLFLSSVRIILMGSEGQIVDLLQSMAELSNMEMDWGIYLSQVSAYRYVALCQRIGKAKPVA